MCTHAQIHTDTHTKQDFKPRFNDPLLREVPWFFMQSNVYLSYKFYTKKMILALEKLQLNAEAYKPTSYGSFCTYFDVHKAAWVFLFPSSENLRCWLTTALPLMIQLFEENMWHFPLLLIFNVQLKAVSSYLLSELFYPCSNAACRSSMRKYNSVNILYFTKMSTWNVSVCSKYETNVIIYRMQASCLCSKWGITALNCFSKKRDRTVRNTFFSLKTNYGSRKINRIKLCSHGISCQDVSKNSFK